jgi:hypothetical protein
MIPIRIHGECKGGSEVIVFRTPLPSRAEMSSRSTLRICASRVEDEMIKASISYASTGGYKRPQTQEKERRRGTHDLMNPFQPIRVKTTARPQDSHLRAFGSVEGDDELRGKI